MTEAGGIQRNSEREGDEVDAGVGRDGVLGGVGAGGSAGWRGDVVDQSGGRGHAEVRGYVYDQGGGGRRGIFREHGEFAVWNVCDEGLVWALEIVCN